jgi:multidrug resistance protein, MATE family
MIPELETKNIINLTWPVMISQSIIVLIGLIDLLFIRQLGTLFVGAISIANLVCTGVYSFLEGLRSGITVLTARSFGAKDKNNLSHLLNVGLFFAALIGIIILSTSYPLSKIIYTLVGNTKIEQIGLFYLPVRLFAAPFILTFFIIAGFFRGIKNTLIPFIITIIVCLSNLILNYLFISQKQNLVILLVCTIAIATIFSYAIGTIISFFILLKNKKSKQFVNFDIFIKSLNKANIKRFTKITAEIGIYTGLTVIVITIFSYMFAKINPKVLAAHQICLQIYSAIYMPAWGFLASTSIIVGKLLGEVNRNLIKFAVYKISSISFSIIGFLSLLLFLFSNQVANLFSPTDRIVAKMVTSNLKLVAISLIIGSIYVVIRGALTAAKDTLFILLTGTATSFLFFLPLSYYLGIKYNYGIFGGYTAFLSWIILDLLILSWRFFCSKNKIK